MYEILGTMEVQSNRPGEIAVPLREYQQIPGIRLAEPLGVHEPNISS